jgi:hypothetical protein
LTRKGKHYTFNNPSGPSEYSYTYNGHGTGDLEGVIIKAEKGPRIWDSDLDTWFYYPTYQGTVLGWPT